MLYNMYYILFIIPLFIQTFLQDKRQTMRLRVPLPNRTKVMDDNSLPQIENTQRSTSTTLSSFSTVITISVFLVTTVDSEYPMC